MTTNFKFLILVIKQLNNKNGNRLQKCHYFFFKLMISWSDAIISRMTSMFTEVRMSCKDSIRTLVLGPEVSKKPPNLSLENDWCAWIAERSSHSTTINIGIEKQPATRLIALNKTNFVDFNCHYFFFEIKNKFFTLGAIY